MLRPTTVEAASRADLEAFITTSHWPRLSTVATYYMVLTGLYAWLLNEQGFETDPMAAIVRCLRSRQPGVAADKVDPAGTDYPAAPRRVGRFARATSAGSV